MARSSGLYTTLRGLSLAAALVLACGGAFAAGSFGTQGTVKIRVPASNSAAALATPGVSLVGEYESFSILEAPAADAATLVKAIAGSEILVEENRVLLNAATLDTTTPSVKALQRAVGQFAGRRMHLVQFAGPVQPAWLAQVEATGVDVVNYIPSNAYLVYGDAKQLAALQALAAKTPVIQWNGAYLDEYRISPDAAAIAKDPKRADNAQELFSIQLFKDAPANQATLALINKLAGGPVVSEYEILGYHNLVVPIAPSRLATVAAQGDVVSIQPYVMPTLNDERQDQIVSGMLTGNAPSGPGYLAWLQSKGFTQAQFTASGFSVDVTDSGIDNGTTSPNHFGLYIGGTRPGTSRIIYNRLVGTPHSGSTLQGCDGHGTLNTHIVLGYDDFSGFPFADAAGFHYGLGVCPWVKAGSSVIFDPSTYTSPNIPNLQSMAYNDGSRISTNSWGAAVGGAYNSDAQTYDALVRDAQPSGSTFPVAGNQEMVIVFSAGNSGAGANTIGAPGTGKNIISVGAAENVQAFGGSDGCAISDTGADSANDIISFSSRGPCDDGRIKPDIMAPGTHVSGGVAQVASPGATGTANACFTGSGVCGGVGIDFFPAGQQFYSASSGTSHSCPCVAGGAALVRQWFINHGMPAPSPAMTKALLLNSARYMNGVSANDSLFSNNQGMGEMNLDEAFNRGTLAPTLFRDEVAADMFTATGQTRTFSGTIADTTKPFRVTLAWTDAPGATSGNSYNNNLDLTVTVGANVYRGNVFSGASSATGGASDVRDNTESVFLPAGVGGSYLVTVTAANINSDGVPNVGGGLDQDFALVVYNGTQASVVVLGGTGANTLSDSTGNGNNNGRIDPGENAVRLTIPVQNSGNINATGVSATLVSNTPTAAVTTNSSSYPNLASGGGSGSNATPYVLSVSPNHPCGAPIDLTLNITSAQGTGTYSFSLPTGQTGAGGPFTTSYTGPAVAIPDNNPAGATATLSVSGIAGSISDLNFRFDGSSCNANAGSTTVGLDHTYLGDLVITLTSPLGTTATLMSRNGGGGNNLCGTLFDDSAATPISSITAAGNPWTGSYSPISPLSVFSGENPNGVWQLHVVDQAGADIGNIRAFSIIVSTNTPSTCDPPLTGGCGSADFNCDGNLGTDADIAAFFACLSGQCPAAPCTSTADFNGDGNLGTDADIAAFFRVLGGGTC